MKRIITIIVLACLFGSANAQEEENKFSFGLNVHPNYSMGIIHNNPKAYPPITDLIRRHETGRLSFSASIFALYHINEKVKFSMGVGYQNTGLRTRLITDLRPFEPDPRLPEKIRFIRSHHNIEIPVHFTYYFNKRVYGLAGASGIINISNKSTTQSFFEDGTIISTTTEDSSTLFRRINATVNLGLGFDYRQEENYTLFVQPYFQYGLLGISERAILNRNILSAGIVTGIRL